ncbi:MAG: hypothetical protein QXH42_05620 [Thermoplasmata archaeon]
MLLYEPGQGDIGDEERDQKHDEGDAGRPTLALSQVLLDKDVAVNLVLFQRVYDNVPSQGRVYRAAHLRSRVRKEEEELIHVVCPKPECAPEPVPRNEDHSQPPGSGNQGLRAVGED